MIKRCFSLRNPRVFFEIYVNGFDVGKIEIELWADKTPKTAENFRRLCIGLSDRPKLGGIKKFKGSLFFRIIPGYYCQSGDFSWNNGNGGESIYGQYFDDESLTGKHNKSALLTMYNQGPNTNNSQFLITFGPCP